MTARQEWSTMYEELVDAGIHVQRSDAPTVRHTPAVRLYVLKEDLTKARKICALGSPDGNV